MKHIRSIAFNDSLRAFLHENGRSQTDLALEINLHPKVFNRKLSQNNKADFSEDDVRKIITTFAQWRLITTREEVGDWLALAEMEPDSFDEHEWRTPPLNQLPGRKLQARRQDYPLAHPANDNLPAQVNHLIGREEIVQKLCQALGEDETRQVTLTGAGGCGKTRIALQVASELNSHFAHGVWFVDLQSVPDAGRVPQTIMQTLRIKHNYPTPLLQSLIDYFKHKQMLLILDNFEQVTDAAPLISAILAESHGLKMLVTSRKVLHIYGEHEFLVPSLEVPDISRAVNMSAEQIASYSAVQLFTERAREKSFSFKLSSENALDIARICDIVDGLPLAIELAASRIKLLSPAKLREKLSENRLHVLTGGAKNLPDRQQTLRNTIEWSYNLLSAGEQRWFARMGIFSNGWTLEAAETMMREMASNRNKTGSATPHAMLDIVEHLLDNSLLKRSAGVHEETRFVMLETLKEYALEQLHAREEYELLRNWHAKYFMHMAEEAEVGLRGKQQSSWQTRLSSERDNLLAALEWSHQQTKVNTDIADHLPAIEVLLRLAASLRSYWEWQGYLTEGRHWLDTALAFPLPEDVADSTLAARAKALSEAARLLCLQNEQDSSQAAAEASISLWRYLDNPQGQALAQFYRGWSALAQGQYDVAKDLFEDSLYLLSPTDNLWLRGQLLFHLGSTAGFVSDYRQMREYYARGKAVFEQIGDNSALADLLKDQSGMAILEGKYDEAIANLLKSVEMSYALGYKQYLGTGIGLLGFAIGAREQPDAITASLQTATLWGAADNIFGNIGSSPWTANIAAAREKYVQIRTRVSPEQWREAWRTGRKLTEEQAIAACRKFSAL